MEGEIEKTKRLIKKHKKSGDEEKLAKYKRMLKKERKKLEDLK